MPSITIIRKLVTREELRNFLLNDRLVKAVVDVEMGIMAVGGEMHADEERVLLENESKQKNLWGINLYLDVDGDDWIEFDSMINLRPIDDNRSRGVDDPARQRLIRSVVSSLVSL